MSQLIDTKHNVYLFAPGEIVIKEQSLSEGLYVLIAGKLEVLAQGVQIAEISQKGSLIGEVAAILGSKRTATVRAVSESKLMFVDNVSQHFEKNPGSALLIAQALAARIMEMNKKFISLQKIIDSIGMSKVEDISELKSALNQVHSLLSNENKPDKSFT